MEYRHIGKLLYRCNTNRNSIQVINKQSIFKTTFCNRKVSVLYINISQIYSNVILMILKLNKGYQL